MKRKLFCEICPFTYRLSMEKEILKRHLKDFLHKTRIARERTEDSLPVLIYQHKSLIRRRLGNVKRIDEYEKCIEFTDGKKIPLDAIRDIKTEG